jgi:hypothetical protein
MPFIIIAILAVLFLIYGFGIQPGFTQSSQKTSLSAAKVSKSSRTELLKMLGKIEKKDAPERKMGAMCYKVAMSPEYMEYVCPLDGEKTVYDRNFSNAYWAIEQIVEMRRFIDQINAKTDLAELKLDESRLCSKCFPGLSAEERYVSLTVLYPDGKKHEYKKINAHELRVLAGFFENDLYYTTSNDGQMPLKEELGKIKAMLGLEESN